MSKHRNSVMRISLFIAVLFVVSMGVVFFTSSSHGRVIPIKIVLHTPKTVSVTCSMSRYGAAKTFKFYYSQPFLGGCNDSYSAAGTRMPSNEIIDLKAINIPKGNDKCLFVSFRSSTSDGTTTWGGASLKIGAREANLLSKQKGVDKRVHVYLGNAHCSKDGAPTMKVSWRMDK